MPRIIISGIRGVVFDLDDTLYPERQYCHSGFLAVAEWLRGRVPSEFDVAARMRELFETEHRRRVFNIVLRELGCPSGEELVPAMVECYRSHRPVLTLHPDAARAIERWAGEKRLGLISDGPPAVQRSKVEALSLATVFDPLVLTGEWGEAFGKPHPRAFQTVQEAWALPAEACIYLADNPSKDFAAPRRLGWRSGRIRRPGGIYSDLEPATGEEPDFELSSLDDLELRS